MGNVGVGNVGVGSVGVGRDGTGGGVGRAGVDTATELLPTVGMSATAPPAQIPSAKAVMRTAADFIARCQRLGGRFGGALGPAKVENYPSG